MTASVPSVVDELPRRTLLLAEADVLAVGGGQASRRQCARRATARTQQALRRDGVLLG